jgi:hypothetical protein
VAEKPELERIARNESLFREVNERIAESTERLDARDAEFVCECADPGCTRRVRATLQEYEEVRRDGATFLLAPGHENTHVEAVVEAVVEAEGDHAVVEKRHPDLVPLVRKLDPRAT